MTVDVDAVAVAEEVLGGRAVRDEPLGPHTTYRVGGPAALYVAARSVDDLRLVARAGRASGLPVLVVGRGSNLLVADEGFPGIAVATAALDDLVVDVDTATVTVGAGAFLPVVARRTAAAGLTGFEWAVGVPGSIGGAVRMNAGGHGSDMAACLVDAEVVDLTGGDGPARRWVPVADLGLAFRSSGLSDGQIVTRARLRLGPGDRQCSERVIADIVRWRRDHQPGGQNCGSVFVNPVPGEVAAGELIDRLGLRGFAIGGARVSEKHANFVQAEPHATAADVRAVMEAVRAEVAAATGFELRSEVRLVGFEPS